MRSVVLALALLVVAATACFGGAAADNNTSGAPDPSADNPQLGAAIANEDQQAQREHRRRATPEAKAQRARSRRAFRNQSSGEAADLARAHFGEVFDSPTWRGLTLRSGDRIDHFLDDSSYVLNQADGPILLVRSAAPLRSVDQAGHKAPIDTTLQDDGAALTPANSPEPARIGKHLADGLRLERSQVSVTLAGSSENPSAQTIDDKAFYANALPQTDFAVASVPDGVETLLQLRSQDSPETSTLHFDLPAGAQLRQSQNGGSTPGAAGSVEIVKDGKPIASVSPPVAFDADHQPVPASYAVDGNDVVLTVRHQSGDWRYPILADPYVIEYFHWNDSPGNGNWLDRWASGRTRSTFVPFDCTTNNSCTSCVTGSGCSASTDLTGQGLYMEALPGTYNQSFQVNYVTGDRGEWFWQAPNALSIVRADWNYGYIPNYSCLYGYILGPANLTEGSALVRCTGPTQNSWATSCTANTDCSTTNSTPSNYAVFGLQMTNSTPSRAWPQLKNVQISLWDSFRPIIATNPLTTPPPQGWVDDATHSFQLRSTDQGSGIQKITFKHPSPTGAPLYDTRTYPCVGDPRNGFHCPFAIPWYANEPYDAFSYRTTDLPEGVNDFAIADADIVGNPTTGPPTDPATGVEDGDPRHFDSPAQKWQVKVDRTGPAVTLSGPLVDAAYDDHVPDDANLHVDVTDGTNDGNPADARSGVASLEIQVDGVRKAYFTNPSPCDSCSLNKDWNYHASDYGVGTHTVTAIATDYAGHRSPAAANTFTVTNGGAQAGVPAGAYACDVTSLDITDSDLSPNTSGDVFMTGEGSCNTDSNLGLRAPLRVGLQITGQYVTHTCQDTTYLSVTGTLTGVPLDGSPDFTTGVTVTVAGTPGSGAQTGTLTLASGQTGSLSVQLAGGDGTGRDQCAADPDTTLMATGQFAPVAPGSALVPNLATSPPALGQAPSLTVEGPLRTLENKYAADDADLYVEADVGPRANIAAGSMTVSVLVDGQVKASTQRACSSVDCTLGLPFTFHPADYTASDHVISVTAADATGQVTSAWTVTVSSPGSTRLTCTATGQPVNFSTYSVGPSIEGLQRSATERICDPAPAGADLAAGLGRVNAVSITYGDCTDYVDDSCQLPLEIQTTPACERNRASYYSDATGTPLSRQDATIRGVPAARFDFGRRLELYTGNVTVVIFGRDQWQMEQAALSLAPTAPDPVTNPDPQTRIPDPSAPLPAPVPGALAGHIACN